MYYMFIIYGKPQNHCIFVYVYHCIYNQWCDKYNMCLVDLFYYFQLKNCMYLYVILITCIHVK